MDEIKKILTNQKTIMEKYQHLEKEVEGLKANKIASEMDDNPDVTTMTIDQAKNEILKDITTEFDKIKEVTGIDDLECRRSACEAIAKYFGIHDDIYGDD